MSIRKRLSTWWQSRSSTSESPEKLRERLDATYRTQTALLQQVRRGLADVTTSRKRVQLQLTSVTQQAAQLDDQAREAVSRGNDDEARAILTRKIALEKTVADLQERHAGLVGEEQKLEQAAKKVEHDVEGFRIRKDTLAARHTAAAARAEINDATSGINSSVSEVGQAMAAAERRTRELEATADAVDELVAEGIVTHPGESTDDAFARQFDAALDSSEVDRQLAELSKPQLTDPRTTGRQEDGSGSH